MRSDGCDKITVLTAKKGVRKDYLRRCIGRVTKRQVNNISIRLDEQEEKLSHWPTRNQKI